MPPVVVCGSCMDVFPLVLVFNNLLWGRAPSTKTHPIWPLEGCRGANIGYRLCAHWYDIQLGDVFVWATYVHQPLDS